MRPVHSAIWMLTYSTASSINLPNFVQFWKPVHEISAAKVRRFCRRRDPHKNSKLKRYSLRMKPVCLTYNCVFTVCSYRVLLCVLIVFLSFFLLCMYVCFSVSCCIIMRIKVYISIVETKKSSLYRWKPGFTDPWTLTLHGAKYIGIVLELGELGSSGVQGRRQNWVDDTPTPRLRVLSTPPDWLGV